MTSETLCKDADAEKKPVAWMWEMHGWLITAHSKHRGIKRYVDLCPPPTNVRNCDDFIRLAPLYENA